MDHIWRLYSTKIGHFCAKIYKKKTDFCQILCSFVIFLVNVLKNLSIFLKFIRFLPLLDHIWGLYSIKKDLFVQKSYQICPIFARVCAVLSKIREFSVFCCIFYVFFRFYQFWAIFWDFTAFKRIIFVKTICAILSKVRGFLVFCIFLSIF